jgi:hypothetical protein
LALSPARIGRNRAPEIRTHSFKPVKIKKIPLYR